MEGDGRRTISGMRRYPAAYPCSTPPQKNDKEERT